MKFLVKNVKNIVVVVVTREKKKRRKVEGVRYIGKLMIVKQCRSSVGCGD